MGLDLSKPRFGLIPTPSYTLSKPHKCKPPGWLVHFWYWLWREPIKEGSVWRCTCGKVFEYQTVKLHDTAYPGGPVCLLNHLIWMPSNFEAWFSKGGRAEL